MTTEQYAIPGLRNVLYIDLTNLSYHIEERSDLYEKYLGGVGVATNLMLEEYKEGTDPLDPEMPIIFSTGPLSGVYPTCTKTVALFRSPLNGELGESYAGGHLAMSLRYSGYETIVIKGSSRYPVYVTVHDDKVTFRDASSIWNLSSAIDVGQVLRRVEPGAGRRSIVRIGPAGEKGITYASVNVDTYRHFGRLGLGTVFGAKKLKAILVAGNREIKSPEHDAYKKMCKTLYETIVKTGLMEKYHNLGTSENILVLNELKGLPTRNLQATCIEGVENISGENFAEKYLIRRVSCAGCPIGCVHVAMLKRPFSKAHEYETLNVSYDFELIYALGSNLEVADPEAVLELIDLCEKAGVDIISMGVVLAWATEMQQRGKISTEETLGLKLSWGDKAAYLRAIDLVVQAPNEFYSALGKGVDYASKKYGGKEFAIQLGGLEIPGYHTGLGNILGLTVGFRHSHLDNAGYSADQKAFNQPISDEKIVDYIIDEEDRRSILNCMVACLFARNVYTYENMVQALKCIGIERTEEELKELGKDIFRKKYELKKKFGFRFEDLTLPKRFFETASTTGKLEEERVRKAIEMYREKRGV
ncbi:MULTISPECIES: aldehyde ferredoxin oxidoreductase family protein [unclassified Methanosarcina]|uniref:aldehyde ferredoxin oxidoreductase family protein n=1 Tax=unclassified Methanosarcina TaxID=2644672 RepID=UPI0006156FA6|nr:MULTISPECIES: aldehyde ferredoxin oxidoreductase family protein [unclassified Methanosarcina]AKB18078.1 Tungsten-containing aldehyde:ferredoxin oxidoreductase [Methanosarcina sp. WWM596]AKB21411.1 Tungsten-containing aldehyde:ferredoxin oxidoreductase [Methanosarcina sp. WH1]